MTKINLIFKVNSGRKRPLICIERERDLERDPHNL